MITINNTEYNFDKKRLKYGQKKQLEALQLKGTEFVNGKPVVKDTTVMMNALNQYKEGLARICFDLPNEFNFDSLDYEIAEEIFKVLSESGLMPNEEKKS